MLRCFLSGGVAGIAPGHPTTFSVVMMIWVWARPIGRAHTHSFRDVFPSASQRAISSQDVGYLLARG